MALLKLGKITERKEVTEAAVRREASIAGTITGDVRLVDAASGPGDDAGARRGAVAPIDGRREVGGNRTRVEVGKGRQPATEAD